ncbi:hypothetical protein QM012_000632 [Aureobasidium pullulans]|uniref:Myb-like domain-containing protein n=1 Tax=Aureobasidium pullulans TaxID=5580 RepID=A0ABR0TW85_AURPU
MPGITWDAEADRKILLRVLKDPNASANINWDALAAELTTDTATCTVAALKKHISRIRVAARDDNGSEGSDSPAPKTPAPKKAKAKVNSTTDSSAGPKTKGKGKAASKRKASDDSEDDDEGTPLTKRVQKAAPDQVKIKAEGSDSEA